MKKREEIELRKTNRLTITIMSVLILANSSITASPFVYAEQNEVSGKKTMKSEISQANIALNSEGDLLKSGLVRVQSPYLDINDYKLGNEYITGAYVGAVKKFKLVVDGKEYFPGFKLLKDNQFEVYAKNKVSALTKSITLISLDEQGKEIVSKQVVFIDSTNKD